MNKYLIKLANHLDKKGLHKEADYVDWILKLSEEKSNYKIRTVYTKGSIEEDPMNPTQPKIYSMFSQVYYDLWSPNTMSEEAFYNEVKKLNPGIKLDKKGLPLMEQGKTYDVPSPMASASGY